MSVLNLNYKEDFKLVIDLSENYDGEPFRLRFWAGQNTRDCYICSYDGETYKNCEMADDTNVLCYFDNHGFGVGELYVEITRFVTDTSMPDGVLKLVTAMKVECTDSTSTSTTITTDTSLGGGVYYYGTPVSLSAGETIAVTGSAGWNYLLYEDESTSNIVELSYSADDLSYTATEDIEVYVGSSYSTYEELTYTITSGSGDTYTIELGRWESDTPEITPTMLALLAPVIQGEAGSSEADGVSYDNTTSELAADNVQDAIDELDATIDEHTTEITNFGLNVGDLDDLETTDKSSIVAAINEVAENSGTTQVQSDWDETDTTSKAYILNKPDIETLETSVSTNTTNIATNASAISTLETGVDNNTSSIGNLADLTTTASTDLVSAINEVDGNADANASAIGTLSDLTTSVQTDLVSAINEVDANTDSKQDALQYYSEDSSYVAATINAGSNAGISVYGSNGYVELNGTQISQTISSSSYIALNDSALTITSPSVTINGNEVATSSDISTLEASIESNTTNISTNASDIADLQTTVATNTTNIATNASAISTLETSVASKQDALQYYTETSGTSSVIAVEDATLSVNGDFDGSIYLNALYINQTISSDSYIMFDDSALQIYSPLVTINGNEVATSSDISTLATAIDSNATNIATNASDIATLQTSVSTNTSNITTLQSSAVTSSTSGLVIEVVSELPSSPDENTIYIVQ